MTVVRMDTQERPLPKAVRVELREIELDRLEGRISEAERDALVELLLESLGIVRAEDLPSMG